MKQRMLILIVFFGTPAFAVENKDLTGRTILPHSGHVHTQREIAAIQEPDRFQNLATKLGEDQKILMKRLEQNISALSAEISSLN